MFPIDAISTSTDQAGATLTGTLLPAVSYDRTLLYCHIAASTGDNHISIGNSTTTPTMQACDTEGNGVDDNFAPLTIASGTPIVWDKATNAVRANYHITWVDYKLASSTDIRSMPYDLSWLLMTTIIATIIAGINLIRFITAKRV